MGVGVKSGVGKAVRGEGEGGEVVDIIDDGATEGTTDDGWAGGG